MELLTRLQQRHTGLDRADERDRRSWGAAKPVPGTAAAELTGDGVDKAGTAPSPPTRSEQSRTDGEPFAAVAASKGVPRLGARR